MAAPAVEAAAIVVPAHDEQDRVGRCLDALAAALAQAPAGLATAVCLVLDRCTDGTEQRARRALAGPGWAGRRVALLRHGLPGTIGGLRDLGLRHARGLLDPVDPARTWLLSTDADSTVDPGWLAAHLRHAGRGAHVVAGPVVLDRPDALHPAALRRYTRILADGHIGPGRSGHAYAANLGVRADAYDGVGGFPATACGEEHALLRRLRAAGHRVVTPSDVLVRTSARLRGRARGGLADLLADLHTGSAG
jgi:glycosyltransferase involved in cell wall biosynthesis